MSLEVMPQPFSTLLKLLQKLQRTRWLCDFWFVSGLHTCTPSAVHTRHVTQHANPTWLLAASVAQPSRVGAIRSSFPHRQTSLEGMCSIRCFIIILCSLASSEDAPKVVQCSGSCFGISGMAKTQSSQSDLGISGCKFTSADNTSKTFSSIISLIKQI